MTTPGDYWMTADTCELKPAFALLLAEAQASGAITSAEANELLSGKQLTVSYR